MTFNNKEDIEWEWDGGRGGQQDEWNKEIMDREKSPEEGEGEGKSKRS